MTEEEIEKQSEEYAEKNKPSDELCSMGEIIGNAREYDGLKQGFIDGAKWGIANAIEWHDLKKNPNDLPPKEKSYKNISKVVLNVGGNKVFYDYLDNKWKYYYSETEVEVTVWCELPQFKDKE